MMHNRVNCDVADDDVYLLVVAAMVAAVVMAVPRVATTMAMHSP